MASHHLITEWEVSGHGESRYWEEGSRQGGEKQTEKRVQFLQLACRKFLFIFPSRTVWQFKCPGSETWLPGDGEGLA